MRFTIRDIFWLAVVVGMACLIVVQTREMNAYLFERNLLRDRLNEAKRFAQEWSEMEMTEVDRGIKVETPIGWPHTLADKWEQLPGGGAKRKPPAPPNKSN